MARVLTCVDATPASDGTCAESVWLDVPGVLPPLPVQSALQLSGLLITLFAASWCWRAIRRFTNPKLG